MPGIIIYNEIMALPGNKNTAYFIVLKCCIDVG